MRKHKGIFILVITFFLSLVFLAGFKRIAIPKAPPDVIVTYSQNRIETEIAFCNWFDKKDGGNSCLGDIQENLVKGKKTISVAAGEKIDFKFKTYWKQPSKVTVYLVIPNKGNRQNFGMKEQKLNQNSFIVPNEKGEQIFIVSGYWDERHSVDYVFKINIS